MSLTFHLIPHTHWDREWYRTRAGFQARLVPMMDDLQGRLEATTDPLPFLIDGQTVILEDYLAVRPECAARLAALVERGLLQIGPWYVLADELIPAGESLVRNLLLGRGESRRFGAELPVLYSPDAFGHPAILPRLSAEFGLAQAVLWRGAGPTLGVERDLFRWRHASGASMLVYHLPPEGYQVGSDLPGAGSQLATRWQRMRDPLVKRAASGQIAVFVGADHHALHPDLDGLARRLQALEQGHVVRMSRLDEFFAAVEAEAPPLPVVEGELRWSYGYTWTLQGVHGTRARLKRLHGAAELELSRVAEPLVALAMSGRGLDQRPLLAHAWKHLVQSQFHDTIAGTVSDEGATEQAVRLAGVRAVSRELARRSIEALVGHDPDRLRESGAGGPPAFVLFNPVPRARHGVTVAELNLFRRDELVGPPGARKPRQADPFGAITLTGPSGAQVPVQVLGRDLGQDRAEARYHYPDQDVVERIYVAFDAPEIVGCGLVPFSVRDEASTAAARGMTATMERLSNDRLTVELHPDGRFSVTDPATGTRYDRLGGLRSEIDWGDTYTVESDQRDVGVLRTGGWRVTARGPLIVAAEASGALSIPVHGQVRWRKSVVLYADSPLVRLRIDLWNQANDHRLRLHVLTGAGGSALAGAPFGSVARQPLGDVFCPEERPVTTAPAHRFVAVADERRGLAVLAPGFFEYDHLRGGDLLITLLRAVGELSRSDLAARPGHAAWPMPVPDAQEPGHHVLMLALAPVTGEVWAQPDQLDHLWEDFALGCSSWWLGLTGPLGSDPAGITLRGAGLVASAVKPAEDGNGLILRAYNARAAATNGAWQFVQRVAKVTRVRADETELGTMPVVDGGHTVRFDAGPQGLVSVKITFRSRSGR